MEKPSSRSSHPLDKCFASSRSYIDVSDRRWADTCMDDGDVKDDELRNTEREKHIVFLYSKTLVWISGWIFACPWLKRGIKIQSLENSSDCKRWECRKYSFNNKIIKRNMRDGVGMQREKGSHIYFALLRTVSQVFLTATVFLTTKRSHISVAGEYHTYLTYISHPLKTNHLKPVITSQHQEVRQHFVPFPLSL